MIKVYLFILCLFSFSCEQSKVEHKTIEKEIRSEFKKLIESAKTLSVESYMTHFDRDRFTGLKEDGTIIRSFSEFETLYSNSIKFIDKYILLEFPRLEVQVISPTVAILTNEYKAIVLLKSGVEHIAKGGGTQVWHKKNNEWKLVSVSGSLQRNE